MNLKPEMIGFPNRQVSFDDSFDLMLAEQGTRVLKLGDPISIRGDSLNNPNQISMNSRLAVNSSSEETLSMDWSGSDVFDNFLKGPPNSGQSLDLLFSGSFDRNEQLVFPSSAAPENSEEFDASGFKGTDPPNLARLTSLEDLTVPDWQDVLDSMDPDLVKNTGFNAAFIQLEAEEKVSPRRKLKAVSFSDDKPREERNSLGPEFDYYSEAGIENPGIDLNTEVIPALMKKPIFAPRGSSMKNRMLTQPFSVNVAPTTVTSSSMPEAATVKPASNASSTQELVEQFRRIPEGVPIISMAPKGTPLKGVVLNLDFEETDLMVDRLSCSISTQTDPIENQEETILRLEKMLESSRLEMHHQISLQDQKRAFDKLSSQAYTKIKELLTERNINQIEIKSLKAQVWPRLLFRFPKSNSFCSETK